MTFHEKFRQYDLGQGHPFRGDRFINAMRLFETQGLLNLPEVTVTQPDPASKEDLLRVHDENYVNHIFQLAKENDRSICICTRAHARGVLSYMFGDRSTI
jgi:acetoin utilization deacetylase AcuC-like enzyme